MSNHDMKDIGGWYVCTNEECTFNTKSEKIAEEHDTLRTD